MRQHKASDGASAPAKRGGTDPLQGQEDKGRLESVQAILDTLIRHKWLTLVGLMIIFLPEGCQFVAHCPFDFCKPLAVAPS